MFVPDKTTHNFLSSYPFGIDLFFALITPLTHTNVIHTCTDPNFAMSKLFQIT